MESLAYVEIAVAYEESGQTLEVFSSSVSQPLRLKQIWSWAAIAALLLSGGLGAALSTAFSDAPSTPAIEQRSHP
ncbi:MAG: hypothetical protein SVX43_14735 [Cyanobacteriota bacterium]|nr:hypothetical protein [Cyanobacteriota bacterium]